MKKNRKIFLRICTLGFASLIMLMVGLFLITPDASTSQVENRSLQVFPTFTWNRLFSGTFSDELEDYVEDQFPFRTAWIKLKTTLDRLNGQRESNGIYLASDGYLIQSFETPDEDSYQDTLQALASFVGRYPDLKQYLMVVPTAVSILSEYLPAGVRSTAQTDYIARLEVDAAALGIAVVDVVDALEAASASQQIFYRTDHHWTTDGAYVAYGVLAQIAGLSGGEISYQRLLVSDSFSGTLTASSGFRMDETDPIYVYLPEDEVPVYSVYYVEEDSYSASFYYTENLSVRNQYTLFLNENHAEVEIETNADTGRVLLVIKDSYANCFIPFLMPDYDKIVVIDPRYYTGDLDTLIAVEGVTEVLYLYNATSLAEDAYLAGVF